MQNMKSIYKYVVFGSLMTVSLLLSGCGFIGPIGPVMGPRGDSLILFGFIIFVIYIFFSIRQKDDIPSIGKHSGNELSDMEAKIQSLEKEIQNIKNRNQGEKNV